MKTRQAVAIDRDGIALQAEQIVCPNCDGGTFAIYVIGGKHQHLQCLSCEESFCDGTCATLDREGRPRSDQGSGNAP